MPNINRSGFRRLAKRAAVLIALVVGAGVQSGQAATPSPPRPRDVWYVYVAGDQHWGYEHVTVRRDEDGTFCYEVEARMLLDFLGQQQEMTSKAKYVVTADYVPVSLDVQNGTLAGASRQRGKVENGSLVLTSEREGGQTTTVVPLTADLLLRACLDDWLSGQSGETQEAAFRVLDEMKVASATAAREKGDAAVWSVNMGPELGQGRLSFDPQGIRRLSEFRTPPARIERTTPEEARKIRHRTMTGREVLMFPVGKPIAAPDRLNSLTVRLTWQGISLDRFQLEDERQKVVRHTEKDGRHEAVLSIRPAEPSASDLGFPVQGAEYEPWLATTGYIKPADPDIVRQAREWIGGEKTALGAVRALCTAESKFLQGGSLIAETLSGPEVLRTRKGKCSEYATLFASLARSAGIPTRIVLGLRLVNGYWIGHMWNEAYVGRWITVDASANEAGGSPALLKLIHSESVTGTQSLRWALTQSLDVAVEEFDAPVAALAGGQKTGIEGPVYTNADFACRITAPDKTWSLDDLHQPMPMIRFKVPQRDDVSIHFMAFGLPAATASVVTPTTLLELRSSHLKTTFKDYEVVTNEDHDFNQMKGRILVFRRSSGGEKTGKMKGTEVMWSDGATCYLLNLVADEKSHDDYAAAFFKLLNSFETLPRAAATKTENDKSGDASGQPSAN